MTKLLLVERIKEYREGKIDGMAILDAVDEFEKALLQQTPVSGSLPPKYEVRTADNGDECIMLKGYNVRVATFSKGTKQDAIAINRLLGGNDR